MKNLKNLTIIVLTVIVLTGCVTQKKCLRKFPPATSIDSVYIEKLKEVPVFIPGDTIKVSSPVNCPDQDLIKVENSKLKQEISIIKGRIVSNTTIKPDTIKITVKETITEVKEVAVPQPVKYTPKLVKIFAWIGLGCVLFAGAWVAKKFLIK